MTSSEQNGAKDIQELRGQIDQTRDELSQTIEALAHKADVKSRAQEKIADTKLKMVDLREQAKTTARYDSAAVKTKLLDARNQRPWLIPAALVTAAASAVASTWLLIRRKR
jgi:hypothetical protein